MNEQDELVREIRDRTEGLPVQTPSPHSAMSAGRRRRRISLAVTALAALVIAVGVALPLRALMHFGEDAPPKPVQPLPTVPSEMIFFSSLTSPDEPGRIYSMPPDGSVVFQLTDGDDDFSSVSVSPDGTHMAYARLGREGSGAPGPEGIYVANANGSDAVEIFQSTTKPQSLLDVQWSPDGRSIAFILRTIPPEGGSEADWTHRLWIVGADGADPHPVSNEQITSFSWSPDGGRFAVTVESTQGNRFIDDLFVLPLDGSELTRLTDQGASRDPIWSPNGEQVAFTQGWSGDIATMLISADGSAVNPLSVDYQGGTEPLAWSPDSTQVLVGGFNDENECSTMVVLPSGETSTLLRGTYLTESPTETPSEDHDPCVQSASWFGGATEVVNDSPTATGTPSPEPASFVPSTHTDNGTTVLPMTLTDGSRVEIAYPEGLRLAELGLAPQTLVHSTQSNGCGWEPIIRLGSMNGLLYQGSEPVNAPPDGGPAMWEGKGGGSPYYLVYEFGDWSVNVPCDRSDFDGLDSWNEGLQAHVTPDGFLVLDTSPPIVQEGADPDLSYGPGFIFGGADDPGFIVLTLGTRCDSGSGLQRDDDSAQWCAAIGDGAVEITVYAPNPSPEGRQFIDSVVDGLEVRSIDISH